MRHAISSASMRPISSRFSRSPSSSAAIMGTRGQAPLHRPASSPLADAAAERRAASCGASSKSAGSRPPSTSADSVARTRSIGRRSCDSRRSPSRQVRLCSKIGRAPRRVRSATRLPCRNTRATSAGTRSRSPYSKPNWLVTAPMDSSRRGNRPIVTPLLNRTPRDDVGRVAARLNPMGDKSRRVAARRRNTAPSPVAKSGTRAPFGSPPAKPLLLGVDRAQLVGQAPARLPCRNPANRWAKRLSHACRHHVERHRQPLTRREGNGAVEQGGGEQRQPAHGGLNQAGGRQV